MKKNILSILLIAISMSTFAAKTKTVKLQIIETSDIHGCFFPWDFINKRPMKGSMARLATYINKARHDNPDGIVLLENGDILQGQPTNYYYNYIEPQLTNIASKCVNYLQYDAQNWGNHDVETGHECFDKWDGELRCPVLGANVIDVKTNTPYLKPYTIIERQGVRIAVIGMITAAIPSWLPESVWQGLKFEDMVASSRKWIDIVKVTEKPDLIIGLFHSGKDGGIVTPDYSENVSLQIAREVPGFDIILFGHDHSRFCETITANDGSSVVCINPANNAQYVSEVIVNVTKKGKKLLSKEVVSSENIDVRSLDIDEQFMKDFAVDTDVVTKWAERKIGTIEETISTRDCFFGSSAFTDLIHNLQLQLTGADISLTAPLTFDASLNKGDITVSDMFKLYKFENKLYTMRLTGREIHQLLEMSYDQWVNTMSSPDDHIMLLKSDIRDNKARYSFKNMTFNFDSAAGIDYTVDVTKPDGEKVQIQQMSTGEPFDENALYTVALNSYRANGGGELLTKGAGIPREELDNRIISRSELDQRYYLMQEIERLGTISPKPNNNWRFVPDEWAIPALKRDRQIIFPR